MGSKSSRGNCVLLLLAKIVVLGFVWVGTCAGTASVAVESTRIGFNQHQEVPYGREKFVYDPELDFMMTKRKVPNGPDPIHNRRARNSKRPPGRA